MGLGVITRDEDWRGGESTSKNRQAYPSTQPNDRPSPKFLANPPHSSDPEQRQPDLPKFTTLMISTLDLNQPIQPTTSVRERVWLIFIPRVVPIDVTDEVASVPFDEVVFTFGTVRRVELLAGRVDSVGAVIIG